MGVNGEALQLHGVYKKPYFLLQVTRESVSVLQVTWESVSDTASHMCCIWTCNEIGGLYGKVVITIIPSYTGKNITHLLPLTMLLLMHTVTTQTATNSWYFPNIALYYGDTYIATCYIVQSCLCSAFGCDIQYAMEVTNSVCVCNLHNKLVIFSGTHVASYYADNYTISSGQELLTWGDNVLSCH